MKLKYLVDQGLYSYFSHKVDECGVHFFDPLYYEETEPFHANLRVVTNIYNNQRIKLVPSYFKKFKKQFQYKVCSCLSLVEYGLFLTASLLYGSSSQPDKLDLNKKSFPKQMTIQNFTFDAQGFRKTKNENPPTWEIEVTS